MSKKTISRSEKSITKEAEKSQKLKRSMEKRDLWLQCQCPHYPSMLHMVQTKNGERLYKCKCGKLVNMSKIDKDKADEAFSTILQIIDQLKIASKPGTDDKIVDQLATLAYNLHGLEKTYNDFMNITNRQRNKKRDYGDDGYMNTNPKRNPFNT